MSGRKPLLLLLLLLLDALARSRGNEPVLLFPRPTFFQFTIGISMPIAMDKKGGIVFSAGFQFNYALPWNLTQLEPMVVHVRSQRSARQVPSDQLNLENIYTALENLLDEHGWGRECLLRTICELAGTPLARSGQDVVEEIIHLLLTPSEEPGGAPEAYVEAERRGARGGGAECALAYGACAESPLQAFTAPV